ncbi:MAG: alpha/beta hydrolase [Pseudomonadota bacterium]
MVNDAHSEALAVISDAVGETHEGLVSFTKKLNAIEAPPSFWWREHPVWCATHANETFSAWPITRKGTTHIIVHSSNGLSDYWFDVAALRDFLTDQIDVTLSKAELALFVDLASGLSLDQSAEAAQVAIATRRKQLQNCFRKLGVTSQPEIVSVANRVVGRMASVLDDLHGPGVQDWSGYIRFLPDGIRCGVIEGPAKRPVRYLEIGPRDGTAVLVLHPMIFPHFDPDDVALCHNLGLRLIWPIRPGCLATRGAGVEKWMQHCEDVVADLRTIQTMCAGTSVPVIALVSSGAYATHFAAKHPEAVRQIDYVSTCYSAGKRTTKDVYFGGFLLRKLQQNARMAAVAIQHLAASALRRDRFEKSLRRVFRGSRADQVLLDAEFGDSLRVDRLNYAVRHSISSMRLDYLSQLHFDWRMAAELSIPKTFWHGRDDTVHDFDDLSSLAQMVSGTQPKPIPDAGHLTQGAPLRAALSKIRQTYST